MILFVGSQEKGYFGEEVAAKKKLDYIYVPASLHIEEQVQAILKYKEDAKYIIFHLEQYADEPEIISGWIVKIKEAIHVNIIILATNFSPGSQLVTMLYGKGIRNFIFPIYLGEQKEWLELCLDGYFENFGYARKGIVFGEEEREEEEEKGLTEKGKSIGIVGAIARMGTTTQAIQFIKYFIFTGHSAAYVQMNNHHWVEDLAEAYVEAEHDQEMGCVSYQGVDMYYRLDKLREVKKEYEYLIYDYGVNSEHDFNKVSFLEKDVQIFVVGSMPGEFDKTYEVIKSSFYQTVYYIFNFVAKTEQKDLMELMEGKEEYTYFAGEARDPFSYAGDTEIYEKIIPAENIAVKKKKHLFFGKRRGGKL